MFNQPFFIPAALFFIAAVPLLLRLIPRNRFYGIRTAKTMKDDLIWYSANRFGAVVIVLSSILYFLIAAMFPAGGTHDSDFSLWLLHLSAFALPLFISFYFISRYIKRF